MAAVRNPETKLVALESLRPYERNPRRGDLPAIRESLRANGQYRPIVVRRKTREILAGNHTWRAAREEGWADIWATFITCDDDTAKRVVLVDNRSNDLAGYDEPALAELLGELPSFEGSGYTPGDLDELLARSQADWDSVLADAGGSESEFQGMTFHLTADQADEVRRALEAAKAHGDFGDTGNPNGNGNALARICQTFVTAHDG